MARSLSGCPGLGPPPFDPFGRGTFAEGRAGPLLTPALVSLLLMAPGGAMAQEVVMKRVWRDYGLSITLIGLFLISWTLQTWMGWTEFVSEQQQHGQVAQAFGPDGYFWRWGQSTFENWQSEFLQVFIFVVLTTFLIHRKSHESPDTDYDTEAALRRIEAKMDALEKQVAK